MSELYHYGVVGMKWGVHRAKSKISANDRLQTKALKYDKKSAQMTKKSEQIHAKEDLDGSNRKATRAAKRDKKAAVLQKKALNADNEVKSMMLERRAETLKYKAAKDRRTANRLSKTAGYSAKSMKYSIKSDKAATRAAKARMQIANNKAYVARMNQKISTISKEDLRGAYAFVNELRNS